MAVFDHQQHPATLVHETMWTVVIDNPGKTMRVKRFNTKREAQAYLNERDGPHLRNDHAYILKPGNKTN